MSGRNKRRKATNNRGSKKTKRTNDLKDDNVDPECPFEVKTSTGERIFNDKMFDGVDITDFCSNSDEESDDDIRCKKLNEMYATSKKRLETFEGNPKDVGYTTKRGKIKNNYGSKATRREESRYNEKPKPSQTTALWSGLNTLIDEEALIDMIEDQITQALRQSYEKEPQNKLQNEDGFHYYDQPGIPKYLYDCKKRIIEGLPLQGSKALERFVHEMNYKKGEHVDLKSYHPTVRLSLSNQKQHNKEEEEARKEKIKLDRFHHKKAGFLLSDEGLEEYKANYLYRKGLIQKKVNTTNDPVETEDNIQRYPVDQYKKITQSINGKRNTTSEFSTTTTTTAATKVVNTDKMSNTTQQNVNFDFY